MNIFNKKLATIIIGIALSFSVQSIYADAPPDPGGGGPGTGDLPVGGGAPLTGGLAMLIAMGTAYGLRKVYSRQNKDK